MVGAGAIQTEPQPGRGGTWWVRNSGGSWSHLSGGARPQTSEMVKTFGERCPSVIVNNNPQMADYAVIFDHEGGKFVRKDNKIAVFNRIGDSIFSHSTRSLGNSVKDACSAILADWQAHRQKSAATNQPAQSAGADPPQVPSKPAALAVTAPATQSSEKSGPSPSDAPDAREGIIPVLGIVVGKWERGGAEILEIEPGSVAEEAYLHVGDVINSLNGRPIRDCALLASELSGRGKGTQVRLGYLYRSVSIGYVAKQVIVILR